MSEVNSFLEHHGVRGMHWGVRRSKSKTGVSRYDGATLDRNARYEHRLNKMIAKGDLSTKKKVALVAASAALTGGPGAVAALGYIHARKPENMKITLKRIHEQNDRIKSGQKNILDRLDQFANVRTGDLLISRRPEGS